MAAWPEPPNYHDHPDVGYKVLLQQPGFPCIYPQPTFSEVAINMRPGMWGLTAGLALFGAAAGYYKGSAIHWQRPAMYFTAAFFGKTGLFIGMGDSAYRLMGYKENAREVRSCMPHLLQREAY